LAFVSRKNRRETAGFFGIPGILLPDLLELEPFAQVFIEMATGLSRKRFQFRLATSWAGLIE
jgi:hypothetical protein